MRRTAECIERSRVQGSKAAMRATARKYSPQYCTTVGGGCRGGACHIRHTSRQSVLCTQCSPCRGNRTATAKGAVMAGACRIQTRALLPDETQQGRFARAHKWHGATHSTACAALRPHDHAFLPTGSATGHSTQRQAPSLTRCHVMPAAMS